MSKDVQKPAALASLTETYTDSEGSAVEYSDDEDDSRSNNNNANRYSLTVPEVSDEKSNSGASTPITSAYSISALENKRPALLVSYSTNEDGERDENARISFDTSEPMDISPVHTSEVKKPEESKRAVSPVTFHRTLLSMKPDEIELPPEHQGRCSLALQEKFAKHYEKKVKEGKNMNDSIQRRKDFRNPSIYEKLIAYCGIDEMGTNYPPEIYDPHDWYPTSFYDELAKRQKEEMDKKEKERKEKTKVEFISGTKKTQSDATTTAIELAMKRRSKWDMGASQGTVLPLPVKPATLITPSVVPITSATGTKPTVISAFGTISKKKQ